MQTGSYAIKTMQRIAIIGNHGTERSRLGQQLGRIFYLPVIHLDEELAQPGWDRQAEGAAVARVRRLTGGERWIIEGTDTAALDPLFTAADTLVFLDFSRWRCLWRLLKRALAQRQRPNWQRLRALWRYPQQRRPLVLLKMVQHATGRQIFVFRRPRDLQAWLMHAALSMRT